MIAQVRTFGGWGPGGSNWVMIYFLKTTPTDFKTLEEIHWKGAR